MKVIDFFSGCGGASEGLRQAGFNITIGLDFDEKAAKTYQANFPEASFFHADIRTVNETEFTKFFKKKKPYQGACCFCCMCSMPTFF
ncbi:DNA cytosine methyltransferase [Acinetobacter baumannii]|nr:DNA cytosine methyltransferase [Acinetobacter baumannii]